MSEPTTPEAAVRRYLSWLDDPTSLVDDDLVARAEARVRNTSDPLDRLHALADLERARTADVESVVTDFVALAKTYAAAQDIPVGAFRAAGVDDETLARAGFEVGARPPRRPRAAATAPRAPRAARVSTDAVKAATLGLASPFTLADLAEAAGGGSPFTIRKAIDELIAEGRARSIGPKPDHQGAGRPPTLYELV